jgi:hypothetical protein
MSARCGSPIAFETLVAYWSDDLTTAESDAVEEHTMSCTSCAATSARVAAVAEAVRAQIPPVVTREMIAKLRAQGLRIVENPVLPGERKLAVFSPGIDILLHRLGGLDLARTEHVDVTVKVEETGDLLFQIKDAPFDRETGEVVIACQRHYSVFPPNIAFDVVTRDASQRETLTVYAVPHAFG